MLHSQVQSILKAQDYKCALREERLPPQQGDDVVLYIWDSKFRTRA